MSQVYPYRLTKFLRERVGDGLRSVIYYDADGYELIFVRDDVNDYADQNVDDIVTDLRADSYEQRIREDLHGYGELNCTVWAFEDAFEIHFVDDERRGVAVVLDNHTFLAQNTFIGQCLEIAGLE